MWRLASLLNRYLKANSRVSDEITEIRHQALLKDSQNRFLNEIAYLKENQKEVILHVDATLYPLCYVENGEIKGMLLEITETFEELTGIEIQFCTDEDINGNSITAVDNLISGEFMAVVGRYNEIDTCDNPELSYSSFLWMETLRIYSYKKRDTLEGKKLGAIRYATDYLGWNNTTGNAPVLYDSRKELLNALKNGDIDAVFIVEMVFNSRLSLTLFVGERNKQK